MLTAFLRAPSAQQFLSTLAYDASATTDNRPFFFYNLRLGELASILGRLGAVEINNLGVAILLFLLLLSVGLTIVFVLLPLLVFERKALRTERAQKTKVLAYFLSLGLGFILVELGFMQTFVLFLGHPIYALAVVLAGLLLASGLGSALSGWGARYFGLCGYVRRTILVLAGVLIVYAVGLTPLFQLMLGLPIAARVVIALLLVFVPGLLMGALLPCGVRAAGRMGRGTVAWAWGLNGAASVVGSVLAVILSMNLGFMVSLFVGIGVYGAAYAVFPTSTDETVTAE